MLQPGRSRLLSCASLVGSRQASRHCCRCPLLLYAVFPFGSLAFFRPFLTRRQPFSFTFGLGEAIHHVRRQEHHPPDCGSCPGGSYLPGHVCGPIQGGHASSKSQEPWGEGCTHAELASPTALLAPHHSLSTDPPLPDAPCLMPPPGHQPHPLVGDCGEHDNLAYIRPSQKRSIHSSTERYWGNSRHLHQYDGIRAG